MGAVSEPLIQWFELNRRLLPFRQEPSAYHIWVSEIMLQQTRVSAALPYYERFVAELPDPAALAACDPDKLRKLWQGLGYYSRVANMQKAAQIVCRQYGGQLPADYAALRALPGIGDYTAGAIASIAFGIPAPAVDGNVLRVFARLDNSLPILPNLPPSASSQPVCWKKCPRNAPALITRRGWSWGRWSACPTLRQSARSARWLLSARAALQAGPNNCRSKRLSRKKRWCRSRPR